MKLNLERTLGIFNAIFSLRTRVRELEGEHWDDRLGIENVYDNQEEASSRLFTAIDEAQKRVTLVGISHRTLLNNVTFLDAIEQFLNQREAELHVYFLAPGASALTERAQDEGDSPASFEADIQGNIERFRAWAARHNREESLFLFFYDLYPYWRFQVIDESIMFVSSYPPRELGQVAPVFRLRPCQSEGSLFDAFTLMLNHQAHRATPVP